MKSDMNSPYGSEVWDLHVNQEFEKWDKPPTTDAQLKKQTIKFYKRHTTTSDPNSYHDKALSSQEENREKSYML